MTTDNLSGKWVNFPWLYGSGLDHLIHIEDLPKLIGQGIGIALCVQDEGEFIRLAYNSTTLRVKKEGVKKVLPAPTYLIGQQVIIKSKPDLFVSVHYFFWHHKDGRYCYHLIINNKAHKKRYHELDLEAFSGNP